MKLFLILSSLFLLPFSAYADTKTYYTDTGDDAGYSVNSSTYYGQTFTTNTTDLLVSSISAFGKRNGSPTTCDIGIKAVNGSHYATGAFIVYANDVDISAWGTTDEWHVTDITDTTLSPSTEYAFVYECASSGANYFTWRGDSTGSFSPKYTTYDTNTATLDYNGSVTSDVLMHRIYTTVATPPDTATTSAEYLQECYNTNGTSTCSLMQIGGNITLILLIALTICFYLIIEHIYYRLFPSKMRI